MTKFLIIISVTIVTLLSCVVSQKGTINKDVNLPHDVKHIYIPVFKAEISITDPNIHQLLTEEIITQFNLDGSLFIAASAAKADAILEGKIKNYIHEALDYDENNLPILYRLNLEVEIVFIDNKTGDKMWSENEDNLFAITTYSDRVPPIETEYLAQKRVIEELAQKIVNRTVSGWSTLK